LIRKGKRILSILFVKLLLGKKVKFIADGTILEVANLNRARIQRINRFLVNSFGLIGERDYPTHLPLWLRYRL
jgi:hypothetical protein